MGGFDRHEATARAREERLVDQAEASVADADARADEDPASDQQVSPRELDEMQVRSDDRDLPDDVDDWSAVRDDALVDALAEAFNARDLDGLVDLVTPDCEVPGLLGSPAGVEPAVTDLWNRRPSILVTRVVDDDQALGVLWERAASDLWSAVGTLHVDGQDDRARVLEFSDDPALLERLRPPAPDADDNFWPDADGLDDTPS